MPKFSQIPTNASPAIGDFAIGVTPGAVDQKSTWATIRDLIIANLNYANLKAWIPDYAAQSSTNLWAAGQSTTITQKGFIYVYTYMYTTGSTNCTTSISINGKSVADQTIEQAAGNGARPGTMAHVFPVNAGDVVSYATNGNLNSRGAYFYPGRWV